MENVSVWIQIWGAPFNMVSPQVATLDKNLLFPRLENIGCIFDFSQKNGDALLTMDNIKK